MAHRRAGYAIPVDDSRRPLLIGETAQEKEERLAREAATKKNAASIFQWILLGVAICVGFTGVGLGISAVNDFRTGFSSPKAYIGALTVGAPPIITKRRNAQHAREDGDMLIVGGSTTITGDLTVTGSVSSTPVVSCTGTTLNASKTTAPIYEQSIYYDWSVSKALASSNNLTLTPTQCFSSQFTVNAQRTITSTSYASYLRGQIEVCNGGSYATENLKIDDVVQAHCIGQLGSDCSYSLGSGGFKDTATVYPIDLSVKPVLAAGECYTYTYSIDVTNLLIGSTCQSGSANCRVLGTLCDFPGGSACPNCASVPRCSLKNTARVTITNHAGYVPYCGACANNPTGPGCKCPGPEVCPFGPAFNGGGVKADAAPFPTTPNSIKEFNETAQISDNTIIGPGLTCTQLPGGNILIPTEGVCEFDNTSNVASCDIFTECCNTAIECDTWSVFEDYVQLATVNETTTLSKYSNHAGPVQIYSGACPGLGCTLTIGFWKTHAGFTGRNADRVTPYLPITLGCPPAQYAKGATVTSATQAVSILTFAALSGGAKNGLNKLAAQLLAAKLNIANGASHNSAFDATVTTANGYLCSYGFNPGSWNSLSNSVKSSINAVMTTIDTYNNGLLAGNPSHCS
jgi:phage terminase large subunit-like protein